MTLAPRRIPERRFAVWWALSLLGCSSPARETRDLAIGPAVAAPAPRASVPTPRATPASPPTSHAGAVEGPTLVALAPEKTSACSANMVLVDGDYCSDVKQSCEKSWYDANNRKEICERFTEPSLCIGQRSHKRYCIDRHEWPNQVGERPEVMNNFYQAQVKCAAAGKRLCTESEWTLACEGPELKPYPYGYVRDADKCNGDRPWDKPDIKKVARRDPAELARLWQGKKSGSQPSCVSDFGVADLPGNADEVVASENFTTTWRGKYDSVTTGGPWYRGVRNQCRPKIYTHDEGFYYYYLGFRCCSESDGRTTDPRTPKQAKAGLSFAHVERLARFDVKAMREKLKLKAAHACSCSDRDTLCKTMCGTLLGPGAVDALERAR